MSLAQDWPRLRLAEFYRAQFQPALTQVEAVAHGEVPAWLRPALFCSLFEAVCWLSMGRSCNFFPSEEGNRLLKMNFDTLMRAYDSYESDRTWSFPPGLEPLLQHVVSREELQDDWSIPRSSYGLVAFERVMMMSRRLSFDYLADMCSLAISFLPLAEWEQLVQQGVHPQKIEFAFWADANFQDRVRFMSIESLLAGLIGVLEHMERSNATFDRLPLVGLTFISRLGMLQAWRLRTQESAGRDRFVQLVRMVRGQLTGGLAPQERAEVQKAFSERSEFLLVKWNEQHLLGMSTVA